MDESPFRAFPAIASLSTETELPDDIPVSLDVSLLEVIKKAASLTYEAKK